MQCSSGEFENNDRCYTCAEGQYQASSRHTYTSCISCPAGKRDTPTRTSCSYCQAGTYSVASRATCATCPVGKTSTAGADAASDCFVPPPPVRFFLQLVKESYRRFFYKLFLKQLVKFRINSTYMCFSFSTANLLRRRPTRIGLRNRFRLCGHGLGGGSLLRNEDGRHGLNRGRLDSARMHGLVSTFSHSEALHNCVIGALVCVPGATRREQRVAAPKRRVAQTLTSATRTTPPAATRLAWRWLDTTWETGPATTW